LARVGLADATAVERTGEGTWQGAIEPGWDIGGNANGGYLLAIAGRTLAEATGRPDPTTVTGHFLAPGAPGPVTFDAGVVRAGRRFATATGVLRSPERPLLAVLGSFSELVPGDGPERLDGGPPELPPPEECVPVDMASESPPPFMSRVDPRVHPEDAGFWRGEPSGRALVRGWFRLRDDELVDTTALLLVADAFPPTIFNAQLPVAWTPTLELTVHVRARPAPGWLRCAFRTRYVSAGFLEEDGEVWDATGRLVAQSRQLALVPRPSAAAT
jgi:acyl-CoA thioesterase